MPNLLDLSDELLLHLCNLTFLPELFHFAISCRRIYKICDTRLREHMRLWKRNNTFIGHESKFGSWLFPLLQILRNPDAPHYVRHICASSCIGGDVAWQALSSDNRVDSSAALIRNVVEYVPYLEPGEHEQFMKYILRGRDDHILSLLLMLVPQLRRFTLPSYQHGGIMDLTRTMVMVQRVAYSNPEDIPPHLIALSNLEMLDSIGQNELGTLYTNMTVPGTVDTDHTNMPLTGYRLRYLEPFFVLPGMRSVQLSRTHQHTYRWGGPPGLKSPVEEFVFRQAFVSVDAALGLAHCVQGPCTIRQEWPHACIGCTDDEVDWANEDMVAWEWESIVVPFKGARPDEWICTGPCWER